MGRVRIARLAWALAALSVGLAVAAVVMAAANGESVPELVANHHAVGIVTALGLAALGGLVAARRPDNPIGWLMVVAALFLGVFSFTQQYGPLAVAHWLPGVAPASWPASWTNLPGIAISSTLVFQLFPDGRLPSPRWRPVAWLTVVATVVPTPCWPCGRGRCAGRSWPSRPSGTQVSRRPSRPACSSPWPCRWSPWPPWSSASAAPPVPSGNRSSGSPTPP
jgi:hypothetical protein